MNQPNYYQNIDYRTTPYYGYQQPTGGNVQKQAYGVQPQPQVAPAYPPGAIGPVPGTMTPSSPSIQIPGMLPIEQSYIENILRLNKGKLVTVYATFEGDKNATQQAFEGIIEAAGRDHVIISDPQTGKRYLILMVYVNYVVFNEEVEYEPHFGMGLPGSLSQYNPR